MAVEVGASTWRATYQVISTVIDGVVASKLSKTVNKVKEGITDEQVYNMCLGFVNLSKYKTSAPGGLTVNKVATTPLSFGDEG